MLQTYNFTFGQSGGFVEVNGVLGIEQELKVLLRVHSFAVVTSTELKLVIN